MDLKKPKWLIKKQNKMIKFKEIPQLKKIEMQIANLPLEERTFWSIEELNTKLKMKEDLLRQPIELLSILLTGDKTINDLIKDEFTNTISVDCEMVGTKEKGRVDALARVSIVNYYGVILLDTFVQPKEPVTDYRTWISGVKEDDLLGGLAPSFETVQEIVEQLFKDKIVIGHGISSDLKVLKIKHPQNMIKDTSKPPGLKSILNIKSISLKDLCYNLLDIKIQSGSHSSVIDAMATMAVYRKLLHLKKDLKEFYITSDSVEIESKDILINLKVAKS